MAAKGNKRVIATLAACDEAATLLKSAGFVLANVSLRSEASYYRWPGRDGLIRVATHGSDGAMVGLGHVLAKITFPPYRFTGKPDHIIINPDKVRTVVAIAIGLYFLNLRDTSKSNYDGPNPKNDRVTKSIRQTRIED
jgi:hypothetical protein